MAGNDDIDWSDELADDLNTEDDNAEDNGGAYRRVWPEPSA
jgi:hypothetical protein